jgi:para-aminobenzoate synthetase component 1
MTHFYFRTSMAVILPLTWQDVYTTASVDAQLATDDLTAIFAAFADEPMALLLDSAAKDHPNSRFDIMLWQPQQWLSCDGQYTEHWRLDTAPRHDNPADVAACQAAGAATLIKREAVQHTDPLSILQQLAPRKAPITDIPAHLPFQGGWAGYVSYDVGRTLESMPSLAEADIQIPMLWLGYYPHALIWDKKLRQLWLIDRQQHASERLAELQQQWLAYQERSAGQAFQLCAPWRANMDAPRYNDAFTQVQNFLKSGDCYQINLAQRFQAPYQGSEYQAYLLLRQHNNAPFSAFIRLPEDDRGSHAILSLSPERFLAVQDGVIETKPIKGTKPRASCHDLDAQLASALQQSPKDRAENVMIVDLLRNDLGKVCVPGTVKVPSLFAIESFPAVHHLVSTVTGELPAEASAIAALAAAFPGGSITGAPKIRAMQIIESLEPHRRSIYCGSVLYVSDHGHMDSSIAIRTLVATQQQLYCWAGGGIVADSIAQSEYQETFDKVAKILPVLAQQSGNSTL